MNSFQDIADQYEARVTRAEAATAEAERERNEALRRAEQAEAGLTVATSDVAALQERVVEAERARETSTAEIARLRERERVLEGQVGEASDSSREELDRVAGELAVALKTIEDDRASRQRDMAEIERLRARAIELEEQASDALDQVAQVKQDAAHEVDASGALLDAVVTKLNEDHAREIATMGERLHGALQEALRERDKNGLELETAKSEIDRLLRVVESRESTLGALADQAGQADEQIGKWRAHIAALEGERGELIEQRDAAVERANAELIRIQQLGDELDSERNKQNVRIVDAEAARDKALEDLATAERRFQGAVKRAEQVEADVRRVRGDSAMRVMEAEQAAARAQAATTAREEEIVRLQQEIQDIQAAKPEPEGGHAAALAEAEERVRLIQAEADRARDEAKDALDAAVKRADHVAMKAEARERETELLRADLQKLQDERGQFQADAATAVAEEMAVLREELRESEGLRAGLEKHSQDLIAAAETLQAQLATITTERDEALTEAEAAARLRVEALNAETNAREEAKKLERRIARMEKKPVVDRSGEVEELGKRLVAQTEAAEKERRRREQAENVAANTHDETEDLRRLLEAERASLAKAEQRARDARERADRSADQLALANQRVEEAKVALADEKDQHQRTKNALADRIKV